MKASLRDLRYRLEYVGFLIVAGIFSMLPIEAASALSAWGWRGIASRTRRHQRALRQLQRAFPEKSAVDCQAIARAMWDNMGRTFGEFFHLDRIAGSDRIVIEGDVLAGLPGHKGFVACAAHQANWEIAVMGLPPREVETAGLYQSIKNPYVDGWVLRRRARFYRGGLFEKRRSTAIKLMHHVREGGGVAIMADLRDSRGVNVLFFGFEAPSTPFPAMLARNLDTPLYAATIVREPGVRFRLRLDPVDVPHSEDKEADIAAATANLAAAFEASIRKRPEQWMWAHRRWG